MEHIDDALKYRPPFLGILKRHTYYFENSNSFLNLTSYFSNVNFMKFKNPGIERVKVNESNIA